jgi:hypothetical protein
MKFLEIDVNLSLDFKPDKDGMTVKGFLRSAAADIKTRNGVLMTLAKEDFLIQLCAHLYKEASVYNWVEFGRDQGLYKYMDIYLMLDTFGYGIIDYGKINSMGLQKECYYALSGVNTLFGTNAALDKIDIDNTDFVNEIADIAGKKTYRHEMDFADWVFCPRRGEMLRDVTF